MLDALAEFILPMSHLIHAEMQILCSFIIDSIFTRRDVPFGFCFGLQLIEFICGT